jgi:hypothetical protein
MLFCRAVCLQEFPNGGSLWRFAAEGQWFIAVRERAVSFEER